MALPELGRRISGASSAGISVAQAPPPTPDGMATYCFEKLPKLFPQSDMRSVFAGKHALIDETAFRNGPLEGDYLILAARALGLDCGPMSGFDQGKVNAEFFPDGKWKANFLCNLGYGDRSKLFPRNPRLDFEEACKVL